MSAFRDVAAALSNPSTSAATAVDALVEFIQARRKGGASLYDVTLQLMELLQKVGGQAITSWERDDPDLL